MDERRKPYLCEDLRRRLGGYPVDDFVRAYAKAYFEADVESLRKLWKLLGEDYPDSADPRDSDAEVRAPIKPSPHLDSGAIALPAPEPEIADE